MQDFPLFVGAFFMLPYTIYAVIQFVRDQPQVGRTGTLLALIGLVIPLATQIAGAFVAESQSMVTLTMIANVIIVLVISSLLLTIELRRPERRLSQSYATLGLGLGGLLTFSLFVPTLLTMMIGSSPEMSTSTVALAVDESPLLASSTNLPDILMAETGLDIATIRDEISSGTSISNLVTENGGQVDVVLSAVSTTLEKQLVAGAIPEPSATLVRGNLDNIAEQIVYGEIPAQFVNQLVTSLLGEADEVASLAGQPTIDSTDSPTATATATPTLTPTRLPTSTPTATRTPFHYIMPTATVTTVSCAATVSSDIALNVRSAPDTTNSANVIGTLDPGTTVQVLGQYASGDWLQIVFDRQTGWVSGQYLVFSPTCNTLPPTFP